MSLLQGNVSIHHLLVLGPVPPEGDLVEGLRQDQFRPFEDGLEEERLEEERLGWCDWRNPLICPPDANWVLQERFAIFGLRIDTRRVPASTLRAHVDLRIQALMKENDLAFPGKEARISLQDEVKAELLRKVLPTPKVYEIAWDLKGGAIYTTAVPQKAQGTLMGLFMKSFGCELQLVGPLLLAGRVAPEIPIEALMALDPMDLEVEEEGAHA